MKIIKRIAIFLVITLLLLLGTAVLIPVFFKDEIKAFAKEEINNSINAQVDFADVNLSLLRNFPNLRFGLEKLNVVGVDQFAGIPLAQVESFDLVLDLYSVLSSSIPLKLKSIYVGEPQVHVMVLENGAANYDIAKTDSTATTPNQETSTDIEGFVLQLDKYEVENASVIYDDQQTNTYLKAAGINHSGTGQFTLDVFDLNTKTNINDLTLKYGGINYLVRSEADLDATFNIDQKQTKYTLKDNNLKINDLLLNADGYIQLEGEKIQMDLTFNTPQNNFKNLLSLIPNAYIEGYEDVKATGDFKLAGMVKGTYDGEKEQYPAFALDAQINDGDVKYPGLPLGISGIETEVSINSPTNDFDDLTVNAPRFALKIGDNPIRGRFALKTPISDPDVDSEIKGTLDLGAVSKAFPVEGINEMAGIIRADIKTKARMSQIDRGQYDQVAMQGTVTGKDIVYDSEAYPTVTVTEVGANLTPKRLTINNFTSQLGKSDLTASGTIDNLLAYFSPSKTMKGNFTFSSQLFDADEWVPEYEESESVSTTVVPEESIEETEAYEIFDRFDFTVGGRIGQMKYTDYRLNDLNIAGHMLPNKLTVSNLSGRLKDSDFSTSGEINHIFDYLFKQGNLGGTITLNSQKIDLNEFMVSTEVETSSDSTSNTSTTTEAMEVVLVPDNINMDINANIGEVKYGDITLKNVNGLLSVANQSVVLDEVRAKGLGGTMIMSGLYETPEDEAPGFEFKYDLQNLDFQQTFNGVNTFQQLAPIGKFIDGQFSSSLILSSKLGKDLMPQLNTINAKGFLETINGIIKGFKPLMVIGNTLDIQELKRDAPIASTRNWFEIKEGNVNIQEFDYQVSDIALKIGGSHNLNQTIDYTIKAKVPRAKLGSTVGKGLNLISGEASKLGLNIGNAEFVNLGIDLTGSMQNPKVKVRVLGFDGEATLKDAVTNTIGDQIASGKDKLEEQKDQVVDSIKTTVDQQVKETTEKVTEEAKKILKDKLGDQLGASLDSSLISNIVDSTKVDDIKKELEKWNPFKKKKKKKN